MAGLSVGTLFAYLSLDSAQFDAGIRNARTELGAAAAAGREAAAGIGTAEGALIGAGRAANVGAEGTAKFRAAQLSALGAQERYTTVMQAQGVAQTELIASQRALAETQARVGVSAGEVAAAEERVAAAMNANRVATGRLATANASLISANRRVAESSPITPTTESQIARTRGAMSGMAGDTLKMAGGFALMAGAFEGAKMIKQAGDFQFQMQRLVSAAGEAPGKLKQVTEGVLNISAATGTSAQDLSQAMYLIESGGHHAADGLNILTAAAEGAKVENANVADVARALTGLLNDYHLPAQKAADVTSMLVAAVGHGMTTFQELAVALPQVASQAAATHVTMAELASAMATMTMHGVDASNAATYLRQMLGHLPAPTSAAAKAMEAMGLNAAQLSMTMTSGSGHGIVDGIKMIQDAISNHLTPAGKAAEQAFLKSGGSVGSYNQLLQKTPPNLRTSLAALVAMTGGVKNFQGILQLGGPNLTTFAKNTREIGSAAADANGHVKGFAETQKTFKVQFDKLKASIEAVSFRKYQEALPTLTMLASGLQKAVVFAEKMHMFNTAAQEVAAFGNEIDRVATSMANMAGISGHNPVTDFVKNLNPIVAFSSAWDAVTGSTHKASTAQGQVAQAMDATSTAAMQQSRAVDLVTQGLTSMSGSALSTSQAQTGLDVAMLSVTDSIRQNGNVTAENTAAGVANRQAIEGVVSAAQDKLKSDAQATGSTEAATAAYVKSGQAILDHIAKMNGDKSAADRAHDAAYQYAAQLLNLTGVIKSIPVAKLLVQGAGTAVSQIDSVMSALANLDGRVAHVSVGVQGPGLPAMPGANAPHNAGGTQNWRGGLTWVGEAGPELVQLPRTSKVFTNNESMQMAAHASRQQNSQPQQFVVSAPSSITVVDIDGRLIGTMQTVAAEHVETKVHQMSAQGSGW